MFQTSVRAARGASRLCGASPNATKSRTEPSRMSTKPTNQSGRRYGGIGSLFVSTAAASLCFSARFCKLMPTLARKEKTTAIVKPATQAECRGPT